jgi:hypothetical protein
MKRDWDVIRSVLEEIEGLGEQNFQAAQYSVHQGMTIDEETRVRHILLLRDAGYIKGVKADTLEGAGIISPELTMPGHDLLDTLRSATVWERTKKIAKEKGVELTFDTVKALAKVAFDQIMA